MPMPNIKHKKWDPCLNSFMLHVPRARKIRYAIPRRLLQNKYHLVSRAAYHSQIMLRPSSNELMVLDRTLEELDKNRSRVQP